MKDQLVVVRTLAAARETLAFETTLASRNFAPWLRTLKSQGFRVHLTFLLPTPGLAVARVAERVRRGGHDAPEAVIRRRFASGLSNFFTLFEPWQTGGRCSTTPASQPSASSRRRRGIQLTAPIIRDPAAWQRLQEAGQ